MSVIKTKPDFKSLKSDDIEKFYDMLGSINSDVALKSDGETYNIETPIYKAIYMHETTYMYYSINNIKDTINTYLNIDILQY